MGRDDVSKVTAEMGTGSQDSNPGFQPPQQGRHQASGKEWNLRSLKTLDHCNEPNGSRSWSQGSFWQELPCSLLRDFARTFYQYHQHYGVDSQNICKYTSAPWLRELALLVRWLGLNSGSPTSWLCDLGTHQASLSLDFISSETGQ